jgi:hypothetical protein
MTTNPLQAEPTFISGTVQVAGTIPVSIQGTATITGSVQASIVGTALVSVVNLPATQTVAGSVSIAGTATVTVANLPATQPVSGSLSASILNTATQVNVLTGGTYTAGTTATITMGAYQDLVVDYYVGSVAAGTFQVVVQGIEPQSGNLTSTVVSGNLLAAGAAAQSQRLVAVGPMGAKVAVVVTLSATATVNGAYVTAQPSATG